MSRVLCLLCPGSLRRRSTEVDLGPRLPARAALTTQGWWPGRWRNLKVRWLHVCVYSHNFTLLRVVCHCLSTRRVRALWCSRRALGVPCAASFVSGVAAPSLHRGRPRSTPSLRGDSLRPPALATTCSSRLEFPSAVALPLGEGTYGSRACVRCLRAARPCRCFKRPAERIQPDKNGWAGSHLTNLFQERMGWFPPYETWRDLLTPGSSSQEQNLPSHKKGLVT